jgi:hypothetical protein
VKVAKVTNYLSSGRGEKKIPSQNLILWKKCFPGNIFKKSTNNLIIRSRNKPPAVIRVVLRIHNRGSQKTRDLVLIYNIQPPF